MIEILEKILACPECKGRIKFEVNLSDGLMMREGKINCTNCSEKYLIRNGIIFLRKSKNFPDGSSDEKWELEKFENRYESLGIYKNAWEWGKLTGIPEQVTSYIYPRVKGRILEWININDNDILLDVGCGVGYFIFEIMKKYSRPKAIYIGIDVAGPNIKWLNRRCEEEGVKNVVGIVADSLSLPLLSNSVSYIVCSEVLEHIYQPDLAIKEISRVLKGEGQFLMSTPLKEGIEIWKLIAKPFKKIILKKKKGERNERQRGYDSPIQSTYIKESIEKNSLDIIDFEYNVILPPEEFFKKIPNPITKLIVSVCKIIESHFKTLFKPFATHAVVRSKKKTI